MKKILLVAVVALIGTTAWAQNSTEYGIKAGISYNKNGDLVQETGNTGQDLVEGADGKAGFHIGFWGKLDLPKIYLRPELLFSRTQSTYNIEGSKVNYNISRLDLPVLLGYKLIGPLHLFAGPAFQYILDNDLKDLEIEDIENDFTVGLNIGAGVNLGKLGFDIRYERGFSKNEANFISNNINNNISGRVDARPSQIIFSTSLQL